MALGLPKRERGGPSTSGKRRAGLHRHVGYPKLREGWTPGRGWDLGWDEWTTSLTPHPWNPT
jgi:hypothetical protein